MALKKNATCYKQKEQIFPDTRPPTCWKLDSCFWFVRKDNKKDKGEFVTKSVGIGLVLLKYREIIMIKAVELYKKLFSLKVWKAKKRIWYQLRFIMSVENYVWAIQKSLVAWTNQGSTFSYTRQNSKMFNITSKYFSLFNNNPPAGWATHIARNFLTCYSCSYYSYMFWFSNIWNLMFSISLYDMCTVCSFIVIFSNIPSNMRFKVPGIYLKTCL